MVFIPCGAFRMGSDKHYPEEAPIHRVSVDGFWIDRTPVTNRQFRKFVTETGYVTVAEVPPDRKLIPARCRKRSTWGRWSSHRRNIRSICATGRNGGNSNSVPTGEGRTARAARSAGSLIILSYMLRDAEAYQKWARKELPTAAEWEYAARGGLDGAESAWGDELTPGGRRMANTWHSEVPYWNSKPDGQKHTWSLRSRPAPTVSTT